MVNTRYPIADTTIKGYLVWFAELDTLQRNAAVVAIPTTIPRSQIIPETLDKGMLRFLLLSQRPLIAVAPPRFPLSHDV
jgi:hypothetical protein